MFEEKGIPAKMSSEIISFKFLFLYVFKFIFFIQKYHKVATVQLKELSINDATKLAFVFTSPPLPPSAVPILD